MKIYDKKINNMSKNSLLNMISYFVHYSPVSARDTKEYIVSYIFDESFPVDKKDIILYLRRLNNNTRLLIKTGIIKDNKKRGTK